MRSILVEMQRPNVCLADLADHFAPKKLQAFTDAKSLEAALKKDAGQPSDKRVKVLLAQVCRWGTAKTQFIQMLADVMTKVGAEREPLMEALTRCAWQMEATNAAKARKEAIRAGRRRRKAEARSAKLRTGEKHPSSVEVSEAVQLSGS